MLYLRVPLPEILLHKKKCLNFVNFIFTFLFIILARAFLSVIPAERRMLKISKHYVVDKDRFHKCAKCDRICETRSVARASNLGALWAGSLYRGFTALFVHYLKIFRAKDVSTAWKESFVAETIPLVSSYMGYLIV